MTSLTRRRLLGTAASSGLALTVGGGVAAAARPKIEMPAVIRAQAEKTEISVYHIWGTPPGEEDPESPAPFVQVIDAFNEHSETTVVSPLTPGGYVETLQKTQADLAAGNPPDVVSVPWAFLNYAVDGLGIRALADVAGDAMADLQPLVSESAWPLVTRDETIYGLPWGLSTPMLYYNADILAEAGVDPEVMFSTWDAFAPEALKVQEALDGSSVFGFNTNKDWPAQLLVQSNGGLILNEDGTFGFTSPEAREALQVIADLDAQELYDRGAEGELRPNFLSGTTAVLQASVASLRGLNEAVEFNLGTTTWPQYGDQPIVACTGGSFLGVFTQDEAKYEAVVEFLSFCAGEIGYPLWNQTGYLNISTLDLERLEGQDPAYEQVEQGLVRETNWPSSRGLEVGTTWGTYCERMFANDISVDEGVEQAHDEMMAIVESAP